MASRNILLLSNSKLHGEEMFQWCSEFLPAFLKKNNVKNILFIPYAVRDQDKYLSIMLKAFDNTEFQVESIHNTLDPVEAVNNCEGIFVGGGNTFLLLKTLYDKNLIEPIRNAVLKRGIPYIGSSAGTNVATKSISTTNDMPICFPPSFKALALVPFNINPHYIDADPNSQHMGETRADRIKEYLNEPDSAPVLGLKEGNALLIENNKATLMGFKVAKLFQKDKEVVECQPGDDLSFLLENK